MSEVCTTRPLDFPMSDAQRFLPEGPYAYADGKFSWVAIQHGPDAQKGSLNLLDLATGENQSLELPGRPGFAFPCQEAGTFVVGCERSLGLFQLETGEWTDLCSNIDGDVDNTIINDGMVHEGNLIFGTKDLEFSTEKAGLYLYRGQDGALIRLRDDQICSNGKAIRLASDGGIRLVDIDSPTRKIVSYPLDIDTAILGEPEVLLDLTDDPAVPDGMILTPDGQGVIVSMFLPKAAEFGETRWYDLGTGTLRCVWRTPGSPQNTCPALIRHDGQIHLVITTAVENMSDQDQMACPHAGKLFIGETPFLADEYELPPTFAS